MKKNMQGAARSGFTMMMALLLMFLFSSFAALIYQNASQAMMEAKRSRQSHLALLAAQSAIGQARLGMLDEFLRYLENHVKHFHQIDDWFHYLGPRDKGKIGTASYFYDLSELSETVSSSFGGEVRLVINDIDFDTDQKTYQGMIYFDGVPLTDIGLEVVREHVVTVLQTPALFNDSIRANLTLGRDISDEVCWHALEIAQLKETILELEQQLDTLVGKQGIRLSGGQRQRLAIARMVIANPSVVILDEATSALDTETEQKLHQSLQHFLKNRTTLIIAHRLSAVKQADHVYVFEGGQICEQGKHETLVNNNGLYAKLYGEYQ